MKRNSVVITIIIIALIIILCCVVMCVALFAAGTSLWSDWNAISTAVPQPTRVDIQQKTAIAPIKTPVQPTDSVDPTPTSPDNGAEETLNTLLAAEIPINDPIDLAQRLGGAQEIPQTFPDLNAPYTLGDTQVFWVTNVDTSENFQINTTLRYLGDHVYIWIENGVDYDADDLVDLGSTFDDEIYPTNRDFFGSEWSPGVDDDPRIYIVYAGGLGKNLAGYYSSTDQLHPEAHAYSNAHEMFLINADNVYLWEDDIQATLAHEFQHMIHWYTDMNEDTWLNEGFSMLAEVINGYDQLSFDYAYINNPDLQLTGWGADVGENGPHYGASMLFTTYFLDRFGSDATKAVVANEKNGMESIDQVLEDLDIRDPLTDERITAEGFFADWTIANYLGDDSVSDGRYYYDIYPNAPQAYANTNYPVCPMETNTYDVAQFGVDYIEISCNGDYTLNFSGATTESILPTDPFSGKYFFWSNTGDHSNMALEKEFDFTEVNQPIEMIYQTWYDIEKDYDYVYVSASIDGENWELLNSTSCTWSNPTGNNYGCGLNGKSAGWREEVIDLDSYAGEKVTIRFDYVTDAAVNGVGMAIDDIQIDAIGYFSDFESDDGGWAGSGFVRIQNLLPQKYQVNVISFGDEISVTPLILDHGNQASFDFSINSKKGSIVLVVSGTTPFTNQKADYQIEIVE